MNERDNTLINAVKRGIAKQRWNITSAGWKDGSWASAVEPVEALMRKRIERAVRQEREATVKFFEDHWREQWSEEQIIEALRKRSEQ